jgi:hypothetical protein
MAIISVVLNTPPIFDSALATALPELVLTVAMTMLSFDRQHQQHES